MKSLDKIKERLAKATPGPWKNDTGNPMIHGPKGEGEVSKACEVFMNKNKRMSNADLIAHAPTDLSKLIQALEVANAALGQLALHCETDNAMEYLRSTRAEIQRILEGE